MSDPRVKTSGVTPVVINKTLRRDKSITVTPFISLFICRALRAAIVYLAVEMLQTVITNIYLFVLK